MKLVERVKAKVTELRDRWPLVDHAVRTQEHYSAVQGSQQAGGVTYFGFLSVFPILALATRRFSTRRRPSAVLG